METSEVAAFYSVIRYVADPIRDEPLNIGLVMATGDGAWSRFSVQVPRTRLWAMKRRTEVPNLERWASLIRARFETSGFVGLFTELGRFNPEILRDWSETFGATIRLSEPRVAVHSNLDELWDELFAALVRAGTGSWRSSPANVPNARRRARPIDERAALIDQFVELARGWPTFDQRLLRRDTRFDGIRATHIADLAIVNHRLTGIVQVLPLVYGSETEVITKRALLLEAALDVAPDVVKLAVYDDPPAERRDLLDETRAVVDEFPADRKVTLVPTRTFHQLEARLGHVLFPELT